LGALARRVLDREGVVAIADLHLLDVALIVRRLHERDELAVRHFRALRPVLIVQKLPDRQESDDQDHPKKQCLVRLPHACLEQTAWHRSCTSSTPKTPETSAR